MQTELTRRNLTNVSGKVWLSDDTATFPLYTYDGRLVGYQQYRPSQDKTVRKDPRLSRYFTRMHEPAVWGLEYWNDDCPYVVVCEGIFKACRFHSLGVNAIAVLTSNPVNLKQFMYLLGLTKTLVVVPDPDDAGMKLLKYAKYSVVPDKPLDELTDTEVTNLIDKLYQL